MEELINFFLGEENPEKAIDVIALSFRVVDRLTRDWNYRRKDNSSKIADEAIRELISRFLEHGVGYQFEQGEVIRVDSQFVHSEVVKPALNLLGEK